MCMLWESENGIILGEEYILATEKGGMHAAGHDINHNTKRNQENCLHWMYQGEKEDKEGRHTVMVSIPVRSVTVAEPPRMSMNETRILVARLTRCQY